MYVVFETGGKQYHAVKGKVLRVEKLLHENPEEGQPIAWKGRCFSSSGTIEVTVLAESLGVKKEPKVIIFKKNRRHNYRRKKGHRQSLLWAKVVDIVESHSLV